MLKLINVLYCCIYNIEEQTIGVGQAELLRHDLDNSCGVALQTKYTFCT